MSDTLLETAQTQNEAGSSTEPVTPAAAAVVEPGNTQQPLVTPPAAETPAAAEPVKPAEPAKPEGAPEKYEFKAPEGQTYDAQTLQTFEEAARAANLTQDAAAKVLETMVPALAARQVEAVAAIHKQWTDSVLADKEIGGEMGSDAFKQKMGVAKKFVTSFDEKGELAKLLEDTGLGNHPAVLRAFYRAGKAISEDTFVGRGRGDGGQVSVLDVLYPTTKQE